MRLRSGAKYAFVMYRVLRAAAMDSAKKRPAAVLPNVGVVYSRPAVTPFGSCSVRVPFRGRPCGAQR